MPSENTKHQKEIDAIDTRHTRSVEELTRMYQEEIAHLTEMLKSARDHRDVLVQTDKQNREHICTIEGQLKTQLLAEMAATISVGRRSRYTYASANDHEAAKLSKMIAKDSLADARYILEEIEK